MRNFLLFIFILALTGCASVAPENPAPAGEHKMSWSQREAQLNKVRSWHAEGSIGARSAQKGWNAYYSWQEQSKNYSIQLFGPLGVNRMELTGNNQNVTLQTTTKTYTANSPEQLVKQQLGWHLPVTNLRYWIRGLPIPGLNFSRTLDTNNHLASLEQDGWNLQYERYVSINGIDLPHKIVLRNPRWQVRLVITQWQIN